MINPLDRFDLRPQERRLVVVVAAAIFGMLNLWLVWPHFKDWGQTKSEMVAAEKVLTIYTTETARKGEYERHLNKLKGEGSTVLPAEQALQLNRSVQTQASQSGVAIGSTDQVRPSNTGTANQFFQEQLVRIVVTTGEKELVNFLYALGSGNSMIRVRDLDVKPDQSQTKLLGTITLVASYQKNAGLKPAIPTTRRRPRKP